MIIINQLWELTVFSSTSIRQHRKLTVIIADVHPPTSGINHDHHQPTLGIDRLFTDIRQPTSGINRDHRDTEGARAASAKGVREAGDQPPEGRPKRKRRRRQPSEINRVIIVNDIHPSIHRENGNRATRANAGAAHPATRPQQHPPHPRRPPIRPRNE